MGDFVFYLLVLVFLAAGAVVAALVVRHYMDGSGGGASGLFGPKPERRLDVVEQSNLDGRRRLVLIRRDNKEHLIMTGGPVDVVIETGIDSPKAGSSVPLNPPVFRSGPRSVETAAKEG